jgi:hypothetical protein
LDFLSLLLFSVGFANKARVVNIAQKPPSLLPLIVFGCALARIAAAAAGQDSNESKMVDGKL